MRLHYFLILIVVLTGINPATASDLQSLSITSESASATASGDSWGPVLSPDARFVLFTSTANNLAAGANLQPFTPEIPAKLNVFLRDRLMGVTRCSKAARRIS